MQPFAAIFAALILLNPTRFANAASVSIVEGRYEGEKYLKITGAIVEGDLLQVKRLAGTAIRTGSNSLTLLLNSSGGDVAEATKIGRWARQMMATTFVYGSTLYTPGTVEGNQIEEDGRKFSQERFLLVPVKPGDKPAEHSIVRCYSACVLIFYGGVNRHVSDNLDMRNGSKRLNTIPVIGLHRPYYAKEGYGRLTPTDAREAYARLERDVRTYLIEMGAPQSVADRMLRKASNEIDLVPEKEFKQLYQASEPFIDEWMIARCGAFGPAAALDRTELKEYTEYDMALKAAGKAGRLRSLKDIEDFSPTGMSPLRVKELNAKIRAHNNSTMNCQERSLKQHQMELLGRN